MKRLLLSAVASAVLTTNAFAGGDIAPIEPIITIPEIQEAPFELGSFYTLGLKVGTLGIGVDASVPLSKYFESPVAKHFGLRANLNYFTYSRKILDVVPSSLKTDFETFGKNADGTIDLLTVGLLLDYYPFEQAQFRFTAGAYYNGNKVGITGNPSSSTERFEIPNSGGEYLVFNGTGTVSGNSVLNNVSPYLGMGWGNRGGEKGWSWSMDIGAMYHGTPQIEGDATIDSGKVTHYDVNDNVLNTFDADANKALAQSDLNAEFNPAIDDVNSEIKNNSNSKYFKWYPVVAIGITYSF